MSRIPWVAVVALAILLGIGVTQAIASDDRLPGVWVMNVVKPQGHWVITWNLARDGTYHSTTTGTFALPEEWGRFSCDGAVWSINATGGRHELGAYEFQGDELVMRSAVTTRWKRDPMAAIESSFVPSNSTLLAVAQPEIRKQGGLWANGVTVGSADAGRSSFGRVASGFAGGAGMSGTLSNLAQGAIGTLAAKAVQQVANKVPSIRGLSNSLGSGTTFGARGLGGGGNPLAGLASALPIGGSVEQMLTSNFPLPDGGDDAQTFCLPELAKISGGGMQVRRYRTVK